MTKLDELIQELCPDGVKYLPIPELFITRNGYTPSKANNEFWENGTIPWFRMEDIRANGRILTEATQCVSKKAVKGRVFPENSIAGINDVSDVMLEWRTFVAEEKERQLVTIIQEENLKDEETRRFMDSAFRDGSVKTTGTDIDKLMPPISRFGGGNRAAKKQTIIEKLQAFFERFFGIG